MSDNARVLVKLREPTPIGVQGDAAGLIAAAAAAWSLIAPQWGLPALEPLLTGSVDPDLVQSVVDDLRAADPARAGEVPNPLLCFAVDVPQNVPLTSVQLVEALEQLPEIEWAQLDGEVTWAVNRLANPAGVLQAYLNPSPIGVDAEAAWVLTGGDGSGVRVGVVEPYDFDHIHPDLPDTPTLDAVTPTPSALISSGLGHATAVLGVIRAQDNSLDCVGIAPGSSIVFGSGENPDGRIRESDLFLLMHQVGFRLGAGDVLNVSVAHAESSSGDHFPVDFRPATHTAAQLLSFRGTTVVEGAGNGRGHPAGGDCSNGFDIGLAAPAGIRPAISPAIVVGGIMPLTPLGPFARDNCSNFGQRVDCCAWASEVLTLAPSATIAGIPRTITTAGGTSMATAIITGVVATMQGITMARGKPPLSPAMVKAMLSDPALTSDPAPGQGVGRMPDLAAIVQRL